MRRKNFIQPDAFPYDPGILAGLSYDSGEYERALDRALELVDYGGFRSEQAEARQQGRYLGIGFSSWVEGSIASLKEDDPTVLKPGMCFHIPIAMRIYGKAGVGFSETVVVTETGCEALTRAPRELAHC